MKVLGMGLSLGGIALGVGAILAAPVVLPVITSLTKKALKATIKGGLLAYEGTKVALIESKETIETLASEAKAEVQQEMASE